MTAEKELNTAIIVGSGNGTRFNADKVFLELEKRPVWYYSARAFQSSEKIDEIIMVVKKEKMSLVCEQKEMYGLDKIKKVVAGGKERFDSVFNALEETGINTRLVLIHDAARPLITRDLIEKCLGEAEKCGAVVPGLRVRDTVKRGVNEVQETVDRNNLWLIQTPQVFYRDLIIRAYNNAIENNFKGTDDSGLVEKIGVRVKIIEGDFVNQKITFQEDVDFIKKMIRN